MPNGYIKSKNGNPVELVDAFARNRLPITVNVAVSYTDNTTYTVTSVDRTFEELAESIDSGRQVQASITRTNSNGSVSSYVVPCVSKTASSIKFGGTLSVSQRIQGTWETSQTDILSGSDFLSISSSNTYMYKVATTLMYPDNQTSLLKTNVNPWTPTGDYQPATKKYVDDAVSNAGGSVTDIQINGTSIIQDGIANVPVASGSDFGAVKIGGYPSGIIIENGGLKIAQAASPDIDSRTQAYKPITSTNIDYAVKAALTDGKGAVWTDDEKAAAKTRMGVTDVTDEHINSLIDIKLGDIETALDAILGGDA